MSVRYPSQRGGEQGEIVELARTLLAYAKDKGQIPSAADFAVLEAYAAILSKLGLRGLGSALGELPSRILALSPNEPRRYQTVWQYVIEKLAEGLVTKVEMVEQKRRLTKVTTM